MKKLLIKYGQILEKKELVWGHSGNISIKNSSDTFFISAGGTNLGDLKEEDIISCKIDNDSITSKRRPSMETGLHRRIYATCQDAKGVIHSQPFFSTLMACSDRDIQTDVLPEAMAYLGKVEKIPYLHAGSKELADAVAERAVESTALLLENHGVVCWGKSMDEALLKTQTLEFLCRLLTVSTGSGIKMKNLGDAVMKDFIAHLKQLGIT